MSLRYLFYLLAIVLVMVFCFVYNFGSGSGGLPIVAIANYGPHSSLEDTIIGLKAELGRRGFVEGQAINYAVSDVGFDSSLIPQMIEKLRQLKPKVLVVMTTPVAQFAKHAIKDIPLVFTDITDPVEGKLVSDPNLPEGNMTGAADRQDLDLVLKLARQLMPNARTVGMLYATSELNDLSLLKMMRSSAKRMGMEVYAVAVDQARDVPIAVQSFKGKADFLYVGASGPIQPTLPAIAAESRKLGIPVFNLNSEAVKEGMVLASFGVKYKDVGANTARIVAEILEGKAISEIPPYYPTEKDHHGFVNLNQAREFKISVPMNIPNVVLVR